MTNYFDIPSQYDVARTTLSIPDWFTAFRVVEEWGPYDVSEYLNTEHTEVIVEKRYGHRGGRCFRIDEYCVYDWKVTVWIGTVTYRLRIDQASLRRSIRDAELLLLRISRQAIADYADPTSGTAGGLIDIGLSFTNLPIPQIFGDLAGLVDLTQLLSNIQEIADKTEQVLRELERLRRLDGRIVARFDNVRLEKEWNKIKTFSSVEIVEVECARWILELQEGETVRVPGHDERLFPVPPLEEIGRALRSKVSPDGGALLVGDVATKELPARARDAIREWRGRLPPVQSTPAAPRELSR